jgi:dienelactone hydrolase
MDAPPDAPHADLTGWTASPFAAEGITHDVYRKGDGPGVVLIPEVPGITPQLLALGNHLVDNGFSVASPSLFGQPGRDRYNVGYFVAGTSRACVAREFKAFATNAQRPVARYLRALARDLNQHTPGKGVGVIGMCFSGGFALAAAVDDSVLAPVLSQPSLPLGITPAHRRDPGVSEAELQRVVQRANDAGLCAIGLRFTGDLLVPTERFQTLRRRLGDAFEVIEIDSSRGNEHGFGRLAHSVLTDEIHEKDGHPAYEARKRVVEFLKERL